MWSWLMFALAASISQPEVICDAKVLARSRQLLQQSRYGYDDRERAAWIVRAPNGALDTVTWPYGAAAYEATFTGSMPDGSIAIIHTHPNRSPYPSGGDEDLARRKRITVYVLTHSGITGTDGNGARAVRIGDWNPSSGGAPHCEAYNRSVPDAL
jgi:hypothetical protein